MVVTRAVVVICGMVFGQAPEKASPDSAPAQGAAKAVENFKQDFRDYSLRFEARPDQKLELREEPLLHWSNPARNGENGAVFVWMAAGRPQVIGTVFTVPLKTALSRKHMYHSLAADSLTADYRGQRVWAPRGPGIVFRPIPDAPEPARSPRMRLTQMKAMARDFTARMVDRKNVQSELRLVPQPLIRYEPRNQPTIDGAIFSFALGTDPEALLILEAKTSGERTTWNYAFARFHFADLQASHKGVPVWSVEPLPDILSLRLGSPAYQESPYASYIASLTPYEKPQP